LEFGRGLVELSRIRRLDGVLILALGELSSEADRRQHLHVSVDPDDLREFWTQAKHDLLSGWTLIPRLEHHKNTARVSPGSSGHVSPNRRILTNDLRQGLLVNLHLLKRNALLRFRGGEKETEVIVGQEARGHDGEQ